MKKRAAREATSMVASTLYVEIEAHAARVLTDNPLLSRARRGDVSPDAMGRYLASLHHVVSHTIMLLARAGERAQATSQTALAAHLAQKLDEERGHDRWAEGDLRVLRASFDVRDLRVVPAAERLVHLQAEIIDEDPILHLVYLFWAETFTTLVGGELVGALVERCGVPSAALTCLARHVDLDRAHGNEGARILNDLAGDHGSLPRMVEILHAASALFDAMCEQVIDASASCHSSIEASP